MEQKAPGRHQRKGITLVDAVKRFSDESEAERWFVETRWPDGVVCPFCGCLNTGRRKNRKPQPYHCRACRKDFSVKTGTLMHGSKLSLGTWAIAYFLFSTSLKGVSSMKLHRDLGITQKSAWHLAHRIRETWEDKKGASFLGPVEVDETYVGGVEGNKHASKKTNAGRGPVGKTAVVGMKDRGTNAVSAVVVRQTDRPTLQSLITEQVEQGAKVYTDDHRSYIGLPNHESVKHSVSEYVNGMAHTNGIESFWALLKRGYHGTYHKMSAKHLQRYVNEFSGRHNARTLDTIDQMELMAQQRVDKPLRYRDLVSS